VIAKIKNYPSSQLRFSSTEIQLKKIMNFAYNKKQSHVKLILKFIFVTKQDKRGHKTDAQRRTLPVVRQFE